MSQASKDYARQARMRSLDTVVVRNHTAKDFSFWYDKLGVESRKFVVPKAQKDIGHGKGINHLPRFAAILYAKQMTTAIINDIASEKWEKRKKEIRMLPRAEQLQIQETELPRTNDMRLWYQYVPYKANLNRAVTIETTPEQVEEAERAFREKNEINIPVDKLIWLGVIRKYQDLSIDTEEQPINYDLSDPFRQAL